MPARRDQGLRVGNVPPSRLEEFHLLRHERSHVNAMGVLLPGGPPEVPNVEKVAVVRKEDRPEMGGVALAHVQGRDGNRGAPGGRDTVDRVEIRRAEEDHAIAVPGPSPAARRVAERLRKTPRGLDSLQLPTGEEAE